MATSTAGALLVSTNGLDWVNHKLATGNLLAGVVYGQGSFVAVGDQGTILQSEPFGVSGLRLGIQTLPSNGVVLQAQGPADQTWTIQTTGNLRDWTLFSESLSAGLSETFTGPGPESSDHRFYRGWAW